MPMEEGLKRKLVGRRGGGRSSEENNEEAMKKKEKGETYGRMKKRQKQI